MATTTSAAADRAFSGLATAAVTIASRAAAAWLVAHPEVRCDEAVLTERVRVNVKTRLAEALHDAREAIEANMVGVAEQTFAASMALAGIEGAKEAAVYIGSGVRFR